MKRHIFIIFAVVFCVLLMQRDAVFACTSAIFTGKVTADGRPLLWKHRDTGEENNRIEYFEGESYGFLALVDSPSPGGKVWAGTNVTGFAIMNTASYNLKDDDIKKMDQEGVLMFKALGQCKNLADFERFLDEYERPMRVEANFGVIDAEGGAAYYEVNNSVWVKVDANDPKNAPDGCLIYTNFSYTGRTDEGMGYIRHQNAKDIVSRHLATGGRMTPHWVFNKLSRSFYHSLQGIDLTEERFSPENGSGWVIDQDYIPRKSSTAVIVFQGIKPGEHPEMTVMWTLLGYPPAGVAVPLFAKAGAEQPAVMMKSDHSQNAAACDAALQLKRKTFSIKRGNGGRYMNFSLVYNANETGYMQELQFGERMFEAEFREPIKKWRQNGLDPAELKTLYEQIDHFPKFYETLNVNQSTPSFRAGRAGIEPISPAESSQ